VQTVVDDKHKLIVASEVVNDSSDVGQLHAMARTAKAALQAETLQVLADEGYYSSLELKACEDDGITAYVPVPEGNRQLEKKGRFRMFRTLLLPLVRKPYQGGEFRRAAPICAVF
jgi:hypothetical protein